DDGAEFACPSLDVRHARVLARPEALVRVEKEHRKPAATDDVKRLGPQPGHEAELSDAMLALGIDQRMRLVDQCEQARIVFGAFLRVDRRLVKIPKRFGPTGRMWIQARPTGGAPDPGGLLGVDRREARRLPRDTARSA